jgi:hypothetical protein
MDPSARLAGKLHIAVAFDWGEEIEIAQAGRLVPSELQSLPRRRRTPPSISYYSPPLLVRLAPAEITLPELGSVVAECDATVFDFGAVNIAFRLPFALAAGQVARLADGLADPRPLLEAAKAAAQPLFDRLRPAIKEPHWSDLTEEYFVFQFTPGPNQACLTPAALVGECAPWLAGLVRLDSGPLAADEVAEALRRRISYTPNDLAVVEWAAAVLLDDDCDDSLQTLEFANVQLLEFRNLDRRVDAALDHAYGQIHPLTEYRLPVWGFQSRPLRVLGDMRIDAVVLFSRTSNALKLVGDQYLARLYRLVSERLRLEEWSRGIQESLDEAQTVYEILREESAAARIELLEIIIVVLILIEIALSLFLH